MPEERPILMHARSVKGILDGRKTQTRRVVKPQPPSQETVKERSGSSFGLYQPRRTTTIGSRDWGRREWGVHGPVWAVRKETEKEDLAWTCPYGDVGDLLWVRETFQLPAHCDDQPPSEVDQRVGVRYDADGAQSEGLVTGEWGRKRPSIHMPRWACRILLRVEDIRVEPVQDIPREDCYAEGIEPERETETWARSEFKRLWDDTWSHDEAYQWDKNPWVWVVEFSVEEVPAHA